MSTPYMFPDKDPGETLDYAVDWSRWLPGGDAIHQSQWIIPQDLTPVAQVNTATVATLWISGGVEGSRYTLTNIITTTGGRIAERSVTIRIRGK